MTVKSLVRGCGLLLALLFAPSCVAGGSVNCLRLHVTKTNKASLNNDGLKSITKKKGGGGKGFRSVESLLKTQNGAIYVGTYFGLYLTKNNGEDWYECLDLRNLEITALLQAKNKDIYVGTANSLYVIDHERHLPHRVEAIPCGVKTMLQTKKGGDIYVATVATTNNAAGLWRSQDNGHSWQEYFRGFAATALLQVYDGTIYMTGNWLLPLGAIVSIPRHDYNFYYGDDPARYPTRWKGTFAVARDKRPTALGQVRWSTASGYVNVVLVGFENGVYQVRKGQEQQSSAWELIVDAHHVNFISGAGVWNHRRSVIIGGDDGVTYYESGGSSQHYIRHVSALRGCSVSSFLIKRERKTLFFGVTLGNDQNPAGFYRARLRDLLIFKIETCDYLDLWSYPVYRAFLQGSDGTLYVGSDLGFYSFTLTGGRIQPHLIKQCYVTCLLEDDDKSVYVGTDKGLYRWVSSSQTWTNMPRVGDAVTVLVKYHSGVCYAGTRSRAFYRRMKGLHDPYWYCDDQFNDNLLDYHVSVLSLTRYQHKDVVGTDHGVYYSADGSREWKRVEASKNAIVHTLLKSDNTLYAGTNFGLLATNNSGLTSWTPETLTGHPPVFTMLNCTKQDQRHGYIFAGAGRGLFYRVPGKTNKWQTAPNLQCAAIYALLQAQNGDIFISVFNSGIWVSPAPA